MRRHHFTGFPASLLALGMLGGLFGLSPSASAGPATVTVNGVGHLGVLSPEAIGVNTATWDRHLSDPAVPKFLTDAGVTMLRWPGGSTSDVYHWSTADTDRFMAVAQSAHAQSIFTVNYGSNRDNTGGGDPDEAAAWVDYANNTKHYGVKYWEIGNEIYGNGVYGADWEKDLHADHSGAEYGKNCVLFIQAMKAKDPTIKVGVVLAAPGEWPDTQTPSWNQSVMAACGSKLDFVIVHWYAQNPGRESDAGLLASTSKIAPMLARTKTLIRQYCGTRAPHIPIFLTETNSVSSNPGKQSVSLVNALFLADNYMTWLENGADTVDWWCLHNGPPFRSTNDSASLFGTATYGDYGLLSLGVGAEPPVNTPFPNYDALKMLTSLGRSGDTMVPTTSSDLSLAVHAVRQKNGKLGLLLINKDPAQPCTATILVRGFTPLATASLMQLGPSTKGIASSRIENAGARFRVTVPPYSVSTIVMTPTQLQTPHPGPRRSQRLR